MPKRTDIHSILIIGAGPIVIGQACEFDYSGVQAVKALKKEGYRVILVNSNPATIMTDPELADATYIEPITPEIVAKIIAQENPDAILPTMGGQTALNCALTLAEQGVLDRHKVDLIGANQEAIAKAEQRELFRQAMDRIGLESPRSRMVKDPTAAKQALEEIGLPCILRPSLTLGGIGGGIAYNVEEFAEMVERGLAASPVSELLIEESVLGWKEYEMEVIRDHADNAIIVCSIENIDPMGVHTGDSITVAPALTLTDKEYQIMRNASLAVLREIGVETGGSNVQFAVNPADGRMVVIEMNPRVSRSSALASKATGFPIAKVAALLAVGYTLDEVQNDITKATPASFEPSIDYVVTKIPRFAFDKFPGAPRQLNTSMKSVGEAMAVGRTFEESVQKALRSLETGLSGFDEIDLPGLGAGDDKNAIRAALAEPLPERLLRIAQAFRHGLTVDEVRSASFYDRWFLERIKSITDTEAALAEAGLPQQAESLRHLKGMGFSDARLAKLTGLEESAVRARRHAQNVRPVYKRIDTCAAEFAALTPYMYSTYETPLFDDRPANEADVSDRRKALILGGGPNRIGQGIEFDYCCCHAAFALKEAGIESIMVNCNPETVSTDYDTSDRLYFEPLTAEDVLEICHAEQAGGAFLGTIVQYGGQTPLKLTKALSIENIPVLGTSPDSLDAAEDRDRFQALISELGLRQARHAMARSPEDLFLSAAQVGFPIIVRPSNVLGGRAMQIARDDTALKNAYVASKAFSFAEEGPVLIDAFLEDATEVDVDAISDGTEVYIAGILEHIEEAGVHSGDSACALPPHTLRTDTLDELERQTRELARGLKVIGLMNVQFAIIHGPDGTEEINVLEVNPRASRTVPFSAKTTGVPLAGIAARVMAGAKLADFGLGATFRDRQLGHTAVKQSVFPFARFPGVDIVLGPEMRSTGEAMGIDTSFPRAFAKSLLGGGASLPETGTAFVSVRDRDKRTAARLAKALEDLGFAVIGTRGTAAYLREHGVAATDVNKVYEGRPHIVDAIKNGKVQLVINTTEGAKALADSLSLRRTALSQKIPYFTTIEGAEAAVQALAGLREGALDVAPLQAYC